MTTAKNIGNDIILKLNRFKPNRYTFIDIPFRYRARGMNCPPMEDAILAADAIYDNQMADADHWWSMRLCVRGRVVFSGDSLLCPHVIDGSNW